MGLDRIRLVGLNRRAIPQELWHEFDFSPEDASKAVCDLLGQGCSEAAVLATCQRIEIYAVAADDTQLVAALQSRHKAFSSAFFQHVLRLSGLDAVRHLLLVAAGLESVVLGEPEVLGQVRGARKTAAEAGALDGLLGRAFAAAERCGQRVRANTCLGSVDVSLAAYVAKEVESSGIKDVLVVGTGQLARSIVPLLTLGGAHTSVCSAHSRRGLRLAREAGARYVSWSGLHSALEGADLVVWASPAKPEGPVVNFLRSSRAVVFDLAYPPAFAELEVPTQRLEAIEQDLRSRQDPQSPGVQEAKRIVEAQLDHYFRQVNSAPVNQFAAELYRQTLAQVHEQLLQTEFTEGLDKMRLANRIASKLLAEPVKKLKSGEVTLEEARRLLRS